MKMIRRMVTLGAAGLFAGVLAMPASAQITTGTVTGTVVNSSGGVVPGATVVLVSQSQGTPLTPVITNAQGGYTVASLKADTYTVEVTMSGFKKTTRTGIAVSGGDRVVVPKLTLTIGGQQESVEVTAQAPVIQAASGERSSALESTQLQNLPMGSGTNPSHGWTSLLATQPGINSSGGTTRRVGGGGQDNVMLDGLSSLDTGCNCLMSGMNVPAEAIEEIKVVTSGYQAEYGRASGAQISAVTRGGTNRFHGSLYDYERNSNWNSNSWTNIHNGFSKAVSKQRDWGYVIGGPVGKPGGDNKLFFFYTQEFQPRKGGNQTSNLRLPTALERQGDFSQTLDANGQLISPIMDSTTGLPFADGGTVGKIPVSRLYGPGIALLNMYPMPNGTQAAGSSYNDTEVVPVQNNLSYTPVVRVDYQFSPTFRATWKIDAASARVIPGWNVNGGDGQVLPRDNFTQTIQKFPLSFNTSGSINYSFSPTTFLEASYGINQNRLGNPAIGPMSNVNNIVCPQALSDQIQNCNGSSLPLLFPDAGVVSSKYYEYNALQQIGTPFFQDGRIEMPPRLQWGGSPYIGNVPPSLRYPGWLNINRIQEASANLTKVMGSHTAKAGLYIEHAFKAQNTGGNAFQGTLNFGVDANNPLDSGFPYANEALGIFNSYDQGSKFIEGNFVYNNIEWYLQDNWKVNRQLTLDYGVRFVHQSPYIDGLKSVANFFPNKWDPAQAPVLYVPACPGGVSPCGSNYQAMNPVTGALLGPGTSTLIGAAVLGTGNFANGMVQAGNGISNAGYNYPSLAVAPRFGMAYDLNGDQRIVLRGSLGLYFDRPDGNVAFSTVANPPVATSLTQQWGSLAALSNSIQIGPVPQIHANQYNSPIPKDVQWNAGVQFALPWQSSVDVSYVGHHSYDVLGGIENGNAVNLNSIDLGTTLAASGQDPTQSGNKPLTSNLLRPYQGYSNIYIQQGRFSRTFHSLQFSFTRRFSHGFSFGVNDTWTLSDKGSTGLPGPQLRVNHNADGTYTVRPDQQTAIDLFGNQGTRVQIFTANYVWDLPDISSDNSALRAIGYLVNDWQLSGVFNADSGSPYDLNWSYNGGINSGGGRSESLTGSPDYNARIVLTNLAALGSGCSSNQYAQLNNTLVASGSGVMSTALAGPQVGSVGLDSGRRYLTGCGNHTLDTAIQRNIKLGGGRQIVLRADVYNTFNTVIYTGRQTQLQMNSATNQTVRNGQFDASGAMDQGRLQPRNAGFGAANNAASLRTVQGQIKFQF